MGKTVRGLMWFLIMAGGLVTLLAVTDWLPSLKQRDFAQQYNSIEDAKRALGLDTLLIPAYFPEGISWPPSLILAQKKPYRAVVMEFRKAGTTETALIVTESDLQSDDALLQRITLSEVKEQTQYRLKGRNALLQIGTCGKGGACSRIAWEDKGLHCTVLFMSSPFELIRIAESMLH